VSEDLAAKAAPAGVEVVAAAPRYHRVRVEAGLVIEAAADAGETIRGALKALDQYLHPLTGGEDRNGWPFGGPLVYTALLRLVTRVEGVHAVPRLNLVVDGARVPACTDYPISTHGLLWPQGHQVVVLEREDA
jgi:hypothetical protein